MKGQLQIFKPIGIPVLILSGSASELLYITEDSLLPSALPDGAVLSDALRSDLVRSCHAIHQKVTEETLGYCWVHRDDSSFCCVIWMSADDITVLAHEGMHLVYYLHDYSLLDGTESEAHFLQSLLQAWLGREWCSPAPRDLELKAPDRDSDASV